MKISNLDEVQEYLKQLKQVRDNISWLSTNTITGVSLSILYRKDLYITGNDVVNKVVELTKEHFKKQEQEIINKLLELGVTVENEN